MPHSKIGIAAGDEESWEVFKDVFQPIVALLHPSFDPQTEQKVDLDPNKIVLTEAQEDLFDQYVISTRVRAIRNLSGFALPMGTLSGDRAGVEAVLKKAFDSFEGDLAGKYVPVGDINAAVGGTTAVPGNAGRSTVALTATAAAKGDFVTHQEKSMMFQNPPGRDSFLLHCGGARDWPNNRGIFYNEDHSAACWVNTLDHCRLISTQRGGDIVKVFQRFGSLSKSLDAALMAQNVSVMRNSNLGYLGSCPSNIGTSLRASATVLLPELSKRADLLAKACLELHLDCADESGSKYIVSNKERLGFSEVELVQKMVYGVCKLIDIENAILENGDFDDLESMLNPKPPVGPAGESAQQS